MSAERWTGKMLTPQEAADISGIDAHDVNLGQAVLEPGWIISDEPGLYIDEEEIGIRIEDDLLITEDGCEVLSADILRDSDEIEAFMKKYR